MSRSVALVIGFLLGAVASLLLALGVTARPNLQSYQAGAPPESTAVALGGNPAAQSAISLTAVQRQQISELALNDPRVQPLIGSKSITVTEIVPVASTNVVYGGVATVAFSQPQRITGTWYTDATPCEQRRLPPSERTSPPTEAAYIAEYTNVSSLQVWVDFRRGKAMLVLPGDAAQLVGKEKVPAGGTPLPICGE